MHRARTVSGHCGEPKGWTDNVGDFLSEPLLKYFRHQCAAFVAGAGRKNLAFITHLSRRSSGNRIPRPVVMQ